MLRFTQNNTVRVSGRLQIMFSIIVFMLLQPVAAYPVEGEAPISRVVMELMEDPTGTMDLAAVMAVPDNQWHTQQQDVLPLGYSRSAWWVRIRLVNNDAQAAHKILEIGWPLLDWLDVYLHGDAHALLSTVHTGDQRPITTRPIQGRNFTIPFEVPAGGQREVIFRMALSDGVFDAVPVYLHDVEAYAGQQQVDNVLLGAYFGAVVALLIYNALLYFATRDSNFLYYSIYLMGFVLWNVGFRGLGYLHVWPDYPFINNLLNLVMPALLYGLATVFATHYLESRKRAPVMHWLVLVATALLLIPALLSFADTLGFTVPTVPVFYAYTLLSGVLSVLYPILGGIVLWRGYQPALYFVIAWTCLVVAVLIYQFSALPNSLVPSNIWTQNAVNIGSAMEFLLLAMALGNRYKILQASNQKMEREAFQLQLGYTARLEAQVQERTQMLQSAIKQVNDALDAERKAQSEQREFLATVSHELRTPLTVIDAVAQNLEDTGYAEDSVARQTSYRKILRATTRLASLLDAYLDEGQFSLLRNEAKLMRADIKSLLKDAADAAMVLAEEHQLQIDDQGLPTDYLCDPVLLRLILRTLVDNAVKYTPAGSRVVLRGGLEGKGLWIEVADSGSGVSPEDVERLFEMGYRGQNAKGVFGTGQGLCLARQVIQRQGGTLTCRRNAARGLIFRISLPVSDMPSNALNACSKTISAPVLGF